MRPRRLLTSLSILSLSLLLATVALWVRSYGHYYGLSIVDDSRRNGSDHWQEWFVSQGCMAKVDVFYDSGMSPFETFNTPGIHYVWRSNDRPHDFAYLSSSYLFDPWSFTGFVFSRVDRSYSLLVIPIWSVAALFSLLPLLWLIRRALHRRQHSLCPACGYNLTGNTSGICPECGTPTESGQT